MHRGNYEVTGELVLFIVHGEIWGVRSCDAIVMWKLDSLVAYMTLPDQMYGKHQVGLAKCTR